MFAPGTKVRGYTVERALDAAGGWHELVARDEQGREVMLRVPPDVDGAERIRGEAALAKKHKNENLLPSLELIEHNGWPIQVLTYLEGMTLENLSLVSGPLAPSAVCRIGRQIGLALVELHERAGVAHGALAADRILIDSGGNARLTDVGCARPAGPRRLHSAERRRTTAPPSTVDDLWALGVILADAALGSAFDATQPDSKPLALTTLPERLADALKVLVAPLGSRITNATAAVRIFTEVEKNLGDGTHALRKALYEAKNPNKAVREDTVVGPSTVPDTGKPFEGLMRDAGANPDDHPITQENTQPSNPRTMELTPERILNINQMVRMSQLAEEAARRTSGPVKAPVGDLVHAEMVKELAAARAAASERAQNPPITAAADIHDQETASDASRPQVRTQPAPRVAVVPAIAAPPADPNTLDDAELAALGTPLTTKLLAAAGVVIVILLVVIAVLRS